MSLPRKDIRVYFDHDFYEGVRAIVAADGLEPAAWIEEVICGIVKKRVSQASLVMDALQESGSLRAFTDKHGS